MRRTTSWTSAGSGEHGGRIVVSGTLEEVVGCPGVADRPVPQRGAVDPGAEHAAEATVSECRSAGRARTT